ncbi:MAG: hypothetical protein AAFR02_10880, partial [Pseudomonadota bacterium]
MDLGQFITTLISNLSANTIDVGHIIQSIGSQIDTSTIIVMRLSYGHRWIRNLEPAQKQVSLAST